MRTSAFDDLNNILEILRGFSKAADSHNEEEMFEFEQDLGLAFSGYDDLKNGAVKYFDYREWWLESHLEHDVVALLFARKGCCYYLVTFGQGHVHVHDAFFEWKTKYGNEFGF